MYCMSEMSEKNVKRTQKALGQDSDSAMTPLSLNIVNNITFKRRNVLLVFCCKVLNTKKTNQHKNVMIFLKTVTDTKVKLSAQYHVIIFCFFFQIGNGSVL